MENGVGTCCPFDLQMFHVGDRFVRFSHQVRVVVTLSNKRGQMTAPSSQYNICFKGRRQSISIARIYFERKLIGHERGKVDG